MGNGQTLASVGALLQAGRHSEAARALIGAAAAGDPAALVELAHWRIAGNLIRRDLGAARALLARAGAAGDRRAALLHAYFLSSGTGGPADWAGALASLRTLAPNEPDAAVQLRLVEAMELGPDGAPARPLQSRRLGGAPEMLACADFVSEAEAGWLIEKGGPALEPSLVADPATGRMVPHPVRRSEAAMFGVYAEDLVVNAINRRIAALSGTEPAQGEPLQLLRYRPGDEYKPHLDALPAEANQRILTALVYLDGGYEGGETHFPGPGLSFRGEPGEALLFRNVTADGRPDPAALHAGLPVKKGVKTIASRWIRQRPFVYPPPPPLVDL